MSQLCDKTFSNMIAVVNHYQVTALSGKCSIIETFKNIRASVSTLLNH